MFPISHYSYNIFLNQLDGYIGIQLTASNRRKEIKVNSFTELRISKAIVEFSQSHQGK